MNGAQSISLIIQYGTKAERLALIQNPVPLTEWYETDTKDYYKYYGSWVFLYNVATSKNMATLSVWAQTNAYSANSLVLYSDGNMYIANSDIAANTAWAIGTSGQTWRAAASTQSIINKITPIYWTDMVSGNTTDYSPYAATVASSATISNSGSEANRNGVATITCSTTANSSCTIRTSGIFPKSGDVFRLIFKTPAAINGATLFTIGVATPLTPSTAPTDGFYFSASAALIAPKWALSSTVNTGNNFTLTAATWYTAEIIIGASTVFNIKDPSGNVLFTQTVTQAIPAIAMFAGVYASNTGTTAVDMLLVDYIEYICAPQTR